jgi:RecB family exonuclease
MTAPVSLPLLPLQRISPSRFTALKECALREIWRATKQPALLPSSPAAQLGTVIHQLLAEAGSGRLADGATAELEQRWSELVQAVEASLQQSPLEKSLLPLQRTVPDFEVRRRRAWRKAAELAQTATTPVRTGGKSRFAFEVWVETADGSVGGAIDHVLETAGGAVLRDYKSGQLLQPAEPHGKATLKEEYQTQLKLYAALFHARFGRWPVRLEIMPLQGDAHAVELSPSECSELLAEATRMRQQINAAILRNSATGFEALAAPSPKACRYCSFRPACPAYHQTRQQQLDQSWPQDLWGRVTQINQLGNERFSMRLTAASHLSSLVQIRSLTPDFARYPGLRNLKAEDAIAVYNLRKSDSTAAFAETVTTALYPLAVASRP